MVIVMDNLRRAKVLRAIADRLERDIPVINYLGEDGRMYTVREGERVICHPKRTFANKICRL